MGICLIGDTLKNSSRMGISGIFRNIRVKRNFRFCIRCMFVFYLSSKSLESSPKLLVSIILWTNFQDTKGGI